MVDLIVMVTIASNEYRQMAYTNEKCLETELPSIAVYEERTLTKFGARSMQNGRMPPQTFKLL